MIKLNLANQAKSDIEYKISKFPDGQQALAVVSNFDTTQTIQIKSRLNSFQDLELIICTNQALKEMGADKVELYVPYFLGARSDRKFLYGETNYLKNVICPIINSQGFSKVYVVDPHSDVLEACLNNFAKFSNYNLVEYALDNIGATPDQIALVSPDAGALKKIFDVAYHFEISNVTTASKVRDIKTGNIIKTELPDMDLDGVEHIVIIDDICDGGRTFIELAKVIEEQTDKPIYLIVTHGVFSAGFEELTKYIDGVFCTNSIRDFNSTDYLKQLDIF